MSPRTDRTEHPILTALLTTGVGRLAYGIQKSESLIDEVLTLDHADWETTLLVGDVEYHQTAEGPFPDHQMRISVKPLSGYAALSYTDNRSGRETLIVDSYNPRLPPPDIYLIFNGSLGSVFSRTAAIPIANARSALKEWIRTLQRPACIEWRPHDN